MLRTPRLTLVLVWIVLVLMVLSWSSVEAQLNTTPQHRNKSCGYYTYEPYYYVKPGEGGSDSQVYLYYYPVYHEKPRYYVEFLTNPPGIAQITGNGYYCEGDRLSFSIANTVIQNASDLRFVFVGWSGDYSSSQTSGSMTVEAPKKIIANFETQYALALASQPDDVAGLEGVTWHTQGSVLTLPDPNPIVSTSEGVRYIFAGWVIDNKIVSEKSPNLRMDSPHQAMAVYKTEYYLKIISDHGSVNGEGWYPAGSIVTLSAPATVPAGLGIKYVFQMWTGDISIRDATAKVLMDSPKTVKASWATDRSDLFLSLAAFFGVLLSASVFASTRGWFGGFRKWTAPGVSGLVTETKICPSCKAELLLTAKYCTDCGEHQE